MEETKQCFGTKEYSNKSIICKKCKVRLDCKRKQIVEEVKVKYIKRKDYKL